MKRLLMIILVFISGCFLRHVEELNNTPIDVPENVCYVMFKYDDGEERKTCICAIDMDSDSIVGIQQVAYNNEGIYNFCMNSDGLLFFPIHDSCYGERPGHSVRVFDPASGKEVCKIPTPNCPDNIYRLPGDEGFMLHYFRYWSDSMATNSVIDLKSCRFRKHILKNLGGMMSGDVVIAPDSSVWIGAGRDAGFGTFPHAHLIRFYPGPDTFGDSVILEDDYNDDYFLDYTDICFASMNKIYAGCYPRSGDTFLNPGMAVYEFPSGRRLKYVPVEGGEYCDEVILVGNNKVYVSVSKYIGDVSRTRYIYVFDTGSDEIIKRVDLGNVPHYMAYSPYKEKVYVQTGGNRHDITPYLPPEIVVIDARTDEVIKRIDLNVEEFVMYDYNGIIVNR